MSFVDDLGDKLARDVIAAMDKTGDEQLVADISKLLEASSSKMHESFMTAYRVRRSEARARQMLIARIKAKLPKEGA